MRANVFPDVAIFYDKLTAEITSAQGFLNHGKEEWNEKYR